MLWATLADREDLTLLPYVRPHERLLLFVPVEVRWTPELEEAAEKGRLDAVILSPRSRYDRLRAPMRPLLNSLEPNVYRTDTDGAVQVSTDGADLTIRTFRH